MHFALLLAGQEKVEIPTTMLENSSHETGEEGLEISWTFMAALTELVSMLGAGATWGCHLLAAEGKGS